MELSAGIPTDAELIASKRVDRKRRRADQRKRWGKRRSVKDAIADGRCDGVPEFGHGPHVAVRVNIDHIVPRSLGGSDGYENLRPVCLPIHDRLTDRLNRHRARGLGLVEWRQWQELAGVKGGTRWG